MNESTTGATTRRGDEHQPLIVAEDQEIVIENYFEDWLAFAVFWALAVIVFLQFFTRYVLNDSLAWTEEIARYGLMALTFIGGAMVTRRGTHISVVLLPNLLPPTYARAVLAFVDLVTLTFLSLLTYFAVLILQRMQYQRMTVIDLPMSVVYGAVAFGCLLMLIRQMLRVLKNARDGWRSAQRAMSEPLPID